MFRKVLESIANQFTEYTVEVSVEEGDTFALLTPTTIQVPLDLNSIYPNIDEETKFRILIDGISKLVYLLQIGDAPRLYKNFLEEFKDCPGISLSILSLIEQLRADYVRIKKYPGLKKSSMLHKYYQLKLIPQISSTNDPIEQSILALYYLYFSGKLKCTLNQDVVDVVSKCVKLLQSAMKQRSLYKRIQCAKEIILLLTKLPGNKNTKIHEKLPIYIHPSILEQATKLSNTNVIFTKEEKSGSIKSSSTKIELKLEDIEIETIDLEYDGLPSNLSDLSQLEKDLIELLKQSFIQQQLELKEKERFGDPQERDRMVDWDFRIYLPEHIKNELYHLLYQLKTREIYTESEIGEFINISNYIRLMCGDHSIQDRLFYEVKLRDIGDHAILLVVDQSGSMEGKKIELTRIGVHILATAITELGDRLAIFGFRGINVECEVTPILFWNEQYREQYLSLLKPYGTTPLREALQKAREWIYSISSKHKTIVVLTDGEPTTSPEYKVRRLCDSIRSEGINVIGLGIGTRISARNLKNCFGDGHYVWVPDLDELPRELFRVYLWEIGEVV